ncbi:MAG: hypothetical protein M3Q71_14145 [Chloroflexota bacterium]|nr:hypothetical protein [Chloroflexota bacterium]
MDGQWFDAITKVMARGASRCGALRALTGSVAVGLAGLVGRGVEAAPPPGKRSNRPDSCPPETPRLCDSDCGLTC